MRAAEATGADQKNTKKVQAGHYTLALRSKHRQRRVATRVVRNEKTVKQEGETREILRLLSGFQGQSLRRDPY